MLMNGELRGMIYKKTIITHIREASARGGMITLMQDGIQKVLQGLTDFNEVRSVCAK
jgi:type IV pilus assembly protein PilB